MKHRPEGQAQTRTSWLDAGGQAHAPREQLLGKSPTDMQHRPVLMVPPVRVQRRASASPLSPAGRSVAGASVAVASVAGTSSVAVASVEGTSVEGASSEGASIAGTSTPPASRITSAGTSVPVSTRPRSVGTSVRTSAVTSTSDPESAAGSGSSKHPAPNRPSAPSARRP
ncbi:MAG: hypothetical protein IPN17_28600 [Deltaproteobacteria bacterium]|nr:hypothetical protein [Deltaproteobacteria bacterium]